MDSPSDLIIAFSFSLMPDGAPGSYNVAIAKHLVAVLESGQAALEDMPVVALQWEIADALFELCPRLSEELTKQKRLIVVKPPCFQKEGIQQDLFEKWLNAEQVENFEEVNYKQVFKTCLNFATGELIVEKLNSLLDDGSFYEMFKGLRLTNLVRPKLGDLFTEARVLPNRKDYPNGLNVHQRIRINRLVIERIVEDEVIVPRGEYLSTSGVIESVFDYCRANNYLIKSVNVIAHPLHSPRCIAQSNQILDVKRFSLQARDVVMRKTPTWDASGAQVWCRSQANWEEYERVVSKLLMSR